MEWLGIILKQPIFKTIFIILICIFTIIIVVEYAFYLNDRSKGIHSSFFVFESNIPPSSDLKKDIIKKDEHKVVSPVKDSIKKLDTVAQKQYKYNISASSQTAVTNIHTGSGNNIVNFNK